MGGFLVSDVEPGTLALGVVSLAQSLEPLGMRIEAGESNLERLVAPRGQPFVAAVDLAFNAHLPLVLAPDDVWLCIAQGFGLHVTSNAEALRRRFVSHAGQHVLTLDRPQFAHRSPKNDWAGVFGEFSDQLALHLGTTRDLLVPDFSTTGPIERAASQIVLMSAMQRYFLYEMSLCGIPRIQLLGTSDDWRAVRRRAEVLAEFELEKWASALLPVLDRFLAASQGDVDTEFWRSFYKQGDESGGPFVSGWINVLFPYISTGLSKVGPNPHALSWKKSSGGRRLSRSHSAGTGPSKSDFLSGLANAPVTFKIGAQHRSGAFLGGFVGVSQDADTLAVRPAIGWAVSLGD